MGDILEAEEDIEDAIEGRGTKSDGLSVEGVSDFEGSISVPDLASELDLSDDVAWLVEDGREGFGEGTGRGLIAGGGDSQPEGVMGVLEVAEVSPMIEGLLSVGEIREVTAS